MRQFMLHVGYALLMMLMMCVGLVYLLCRIYRACERYGEAFGVRVDDLCR